MDGTREEAIRRQTQTVCTFFWVGTKWLRIDYYIFGDNHEYFFSTGLPGTQRKDGMKIMLCSGCPRNRPRPLVGMERKEHAKSGDPLAKRSGEGDLRYEPCDTVRLDFPRDSDDLDDDEDDIITAAAPHTYGTNGRTDEPAS